MELVWNIDLLYLWLLGIGFLWAFIGALCGGWWGMIWIPSLIMLWFGPVQAVSTITAAAIGDSIGWLLRFMKSDAIYRKHMLWIALWASIWAIGGIRVLVSIDEDLLLRIVWWLLLLLLPILFLTPPDRERETSHIMQYVGFAWLLGMWAYTTFFWANGWFFVIYFMIVCLWYPLVRAHAMTKFFYLIVNLTAFPILFSQWLIHLPHVVTLFVGMLMGSYAWAHMMLQISPARIKILMTIMVGIISIKILFFS